MRVRGVEIAEETEKGKRENERDLSSICWLTSQMAGMARVEPGQRSFFWVISVGDMVLVLEPPATSSTVLPGHHQGTGLEMEY